MMNDLSFCFCTLLAVAGITMTNVTICTALFIIHSYIFLGLVCMTKNDDAYIWEMFYLNVRTCDFPNKGKLNEKYETNKNHHENNNNNTRWNSQYEFPCRSMWHTTKLKIMVLDSFKQLRSVLVLFFVCEQASLLFIAIRFATLATGLKQ